MPFRDEEFEDAIAAELEAMVDDDDAAKRIGYKVLEMVDRLGKVEAAVPGVQATWHFEVEDCRYKVTLERAEPL